MSTFFLKSLKMLNNNELKTNIVSELVSHKHTCKLKWSIGYWNACERKSRFMVNNRTTDSYFSLAMQIQVLPAGGETTLFKQFFSDWKDKDQTTGPSKAYSIGRIAKVEQVPFDASTLHSNNNMAAQHNMVDDGKGKVQVKHNTGLQWK